MKVALGVGATDRADVPRHSMAAAQWARLDPGRLPRLCRCAKLDLAGDQATKAALSHCRTGYRALDQLRGKRLEAEDFDALLAEDPTRDLLQWMADPSLPIALRGRTVECTTAIWKKDLKFDPPRMVSSLPPKD